MRDLTTLAQRVQDECRDGCTPSLEAIKTELEKLDLEKFNLADDQIVANLATAFERRHQSQIEYTYSYYPNEHTA